jgi:integrase/recombinase XerD
MTNLAKYLSIFLREYLPCDRRASQHTCEAYAYTFQLLVCFTANCLKTRPSMLTIENLDVPATVDFLNQLETNRGNTPRTRNARLAAIKAFFRFLEYRLPTALEQARRIHAIPIKKIDEKLVDFLTQNEMQALLNAPDLKTSSGIRDRAMLYLAFAAGLRVSELVELRQDQLDLYPDPIIHVLGKGRRERVIPLWKETAIALKSWLTIRPQIAAATSSELSLNSQGNPMTRSGFKYILSKHVAKATIKQPSLAKKRISPHVLRHTCAIHTLQATHDIRKVSLS